MQRMGRSVVDGCTDGMGWVGRKRFPFVYGPVAGNGRGGLDGIGKGLEHRNACSASLAWIPPTSGTVLLPQLHYQFYILRHP